VPIFYPFSAIPQHFKDVYQFNPIAALVLAMREVILQSSSPSPGLLIKACSVSVISLVVGFVMFRALKDRFYDYL